MFDILSRTGNGLLNRKKGETDLAIYNNEIACLIEIPKSHVYPPLAIVEFAL